MPMTVCPHCGENLKLIEKVAKEHEEKLAQEKPEVCPHCNKILEHIPHQG